MPASSTPSDDNEHPRSPEHVEKSAKEAEIERDIRLGRKFSLADAIGSLGGGNLLKGASPVPRKRQAEFEIQRYLERNLIDGQGVLSIVLLRRVGNSELFLRSGYGQPLSTLQRLAEQIVNSELLLRAFVTEVDREWGRMYQERPHLQRPGDPPDADDPYTFSSVRQKLQSLIDKLRDA